VGQGRVRRLSYQQPGSALLLTAMEYHMAWTNRFAGTQVEYPLPAFFDGREFRTFKELSIPANGTYVMRATVPLDVIFFGLEVTIDLGTLRLATVVGGTPGGTFSEVLPRFATNNMAPGHNHKDDYPGVYMPQCMLHGGGTHTGGTTLDVIRLKASPSGGGSSVQYALQGDRGIAVGTYYFRFQNLDATNAINGVFKARWEEKPGT
jgi:hypothetical protein